MMHFGKRRSAFVALSLSLSVWVGVLALPGCSDEKTKTGTLVERTPEQVSAEKASMEGMKKAMENMKKPNAK